jgi:hypothetical protein
VQIHYEIFRRVGAKGGWKLHEVQSSRDRAIAAARLLMTEDKATGVKVVKETYNEESGDYLSLKIFEEGHAQVQIEAAAEEAPRALPCFKPDDLYSYHARATMRRLFTDFLARNKITITELIHRADMLEKLEATGTVYQHAVQKVAVAQASSTTIPVQQIVKSLNELATQALHRVYRDHAKGAFPRVAAEEFATFAASLAGKGDAAYLFNGALARHLREGRSWNEKVLSLLCVMQAAPAEGPARQLILGSIDAIIAEILSGSAALHELMGPAENLAEALSQLIDLFLGKMPAGAGHDGLAALAARFAAGELPEARTALAGRIVAEFKSPKRLHPDSIVEELKSLRALANKVVFGVGKYLSHEDLIAAFTLRSKRLVTPEALGAYIAEAPIEERLERLLFVEENVIGAENKRQLGTFVAPVLTSAAFENYFQNPRLPVLQRLQRLSQTQARVLRAGFVEESRTDFAEKMDKLACDMAARAKLFENLDAKHGSAVDKAGMLLKLILGGFLTEGRLSAQAREIILGHLATPGFLSAYFASQPKQDGGTDAAMKELMEQLGKVGITAETGLRTIAA